MAARFPRVGLALGLCILAAACRNTDADRTTETTIATAPPSQAARPVHAGNAVSVSAGAPAFGPVGASFAIESPDASTDTVVYLFSRPVRCSALSFSGWDDALEPEAAALELDFAGKSPGEYSVIAGANRRRAVAVRLVRTSERAGTDESSATAGWAALDNVSPDGAVRGEFALAFGAEAMIGYFDAESCPGGHQP
jgi:hypothetical protein